MEKLECPDCNGKMFENHAGSLTCRNKACGRIVLQASAETARKMLCVISIQQKIIENYEKIIKSYEEMEKEQKQVMAEFVTRHKEERMR